MTLLIGMADFCRRGGDLALNSFLSHLDKCMLADYYLGSALLPLGRFAFLHTLIYN
jgi:hypothetical protein